MKIIFINTELYTSPRLNYTLEYLNQHPFCIGKATFQAKPLDQADENQIVYSQNRVGEGVWKSIGGLFSLNTPTNFSKSKANWHYLLTNLPAIFDSKTTNAQNLAFKGLLPAFDVFEAIFFIISRYEEWEDYEPDIHNRFPTRLNSVLPFEKVPVVDILVYHLLYALEIKPNKVDYQLELSHDVDYLQKFPNLIKSIKRLGHTLLVQKNLSVFYKTAKQIIQEREDPYFNFNRLLSNDPAIEKYLFFIVGGTERGLENHYNVSNKLIPELKKLGNERGYKFGLHPSYNASTKELIYEREKQVFEQTFEENASYNRQHFLRWNFPQTPSILDKNGVEADFTLGFNDRIGFRCGTSYPYRLYDFENEKPYQFIEHPLVVMDVALLREAGYDANNPITHTQAVENAAAIFKSFKSNLENLPFGYRLSVNFHNSTFDDAVIDAPKLWELYQSIISK